MVRRITRLLALFLLFSSIAYSQELQGNLSGVLPLSGSPYHAVDDIIVPPESTLIIEPGVTIIFDAFTKLHVANNATLLAIGTEIDSIRFTCDTTISLKWEGIKIDTSTTVSILSYCVIESSRDGGVYCRHSNPEITHCTIQHCDNQLGVGESFGFGISCVFIASPLIRDNNIINNWGAEGPINMSYNSDPVIENNRIEGNYTYSGGMGIGVGFGCRPIIRNNLITHNSGYAARIISVLGRDSILIDNNIMTGNSGVNAFGAIEVALADYVRITNNVIAFDTSEISNDQGFLHFEASYHSLVKGNVIVNNSCPESPLFGGTTDALALFVNNTVTGNVYESITDSNSKAITYGYNNILWNNSNNDHGYIPYWKNWTFGDPLFRNPAEGNYHLMSIECGDTQDSPYIDRDHLFSLDSLACDLGLGSALGDYGAYGGQISLPCSYIPGDINGSGSANGIDVAYYMNYFKGGLPPDYFCDCADNPLLFVEADVNGSCSVNGIDVTYFVNHLKGGPPLGYCPSCPPID